MQNLFLPKMIDAKNITGIILAGGKSSRMGEDKGLIELNNKPFIKHIINAVTPLVSETIVLESGNDLYTTNINTPEQLKNIKVCL